MPRQANSLRIAVVSIMPVPRSASAAMQALRIALRPQIVPTQIRHARYFGGLACCDQRWGKFSGGFHGSKAENDIEQQHAISGSWTS